MTRSAAQRFSDARELVSRVIELGLEECSGPWDAERRRLLNSLSRLSVQWSQVATPKLWQFVDMHISTTVKSRLVTSLLAAPEKLELIKGLRITWEDRADRKGIDQAWKDERMRLASGKIKFTSLDELSLKRDWVDPWAVFSLPLKQLSSLELSKIAVDDLFVLLQECEKLRKLNIRELAGDRFATVPNNVRLEELLIEKRSLSEPRSNVEEDSAATNLLAYVAQHWSPFLRKLYLPDGWSAEQVGKAWNHVSFPRLDFFRYDGAFKDFQHFPAIGRFIYLRLDTDFAETQAVCDHITKHIGLSSINLKMREIPIYQALIMAARFHIFVMPILRQRGVHGRVWTKSVFGATHMLSKRGIVAFDSSMDWPMTLGILTQEYDCKLSKLPVEKLAILDPDAYDPEDFYDEDGGDALD